MRFEPVAVIGMGAVSALGLGVEALWTGLLDGVRPFGPYSSSGLEACRANIAAHVVAGFEHSSSCHSIDLGVVAAREAMQAARVEPQWERVAVVLGSTAMGDAAVESALANTVRAGFRASNKGVLVDELCRRLGICGPRQVINTACSSGANAVALVCQGLQAGDYDFGLALGCDEISRFTYSGFHALRALDPNPCRPFDRQRRGMSLGEGAGCLVLQRLTEAREQGRMILGCVAGFGMSCDAHHLTAPDPAGQGAALAMQRALFQANFSPEDIGCVNAHGTGTPLNDAAEIAGIERVFGAYARECPVHSVKASTGHCLGAAGALEAIVALLTLHHGVVPPTAGLVDCEFDGRVDCVRDQVRPLAKQRVLSNSFGFGGNNTSLILAHSECYR